MKTKIKTVVLSGVVLGMMGFAGCEPSIEAEPEVKGGLTFDFKAISEKRFPKGTGVALTPEMWEGGRYCYMHTKEVDAKDPRRQAVKKGVEWKVEGDELVIVKKPELVKICRSEKLASNVSGAYSHTFKTGTTSGGVWRVSVTYRMRHDDGAYGGVLITPVRAKDPANQKGASAPGDSAPQLQVYNLQDVWSEYVTWAREITVPAGCDAINILLRIDGIGEMRAKDVRVTRIEAKAPVTLTAFPADLLDGTYAVSAGQCALPGWIWKKNDRANYKADGFTFVLTLPPGYSYVDSTMADVGKVTTRQLADGGTEVRMPSARTYGGCYLSASYNAWPILNALIRADAQTPDADGKVNERRGTMRLHVEYGGKWITEETQTTLLTIPTIRATAPKQYANGFYPGGPYLQFKTKAGREGFADMVTQAGARWVVQMRPDEETRKVWRAKGIRHITPEYYHVRNGFHVGNENGRPESDKYVALPGGNNHELTKATCPIAIYEESEYFRTKTLPDLKKFVDGCDGLWANWEPYMFAGKGCMCNRCRAAFAKYVGVTETEMARDWPAELAFGRKWHKQMQRFRSIEHGKLVKTVNKYVTAYTGGTNSLGFIPGIAWCEMAQNWRPSNIAAEVQAIDYAGSLKWIDPWGPYPWWDAAAPYVPSDHGFLSYFLVAKDVRAQVNLDYAGHTPKLMSFPHGVQCGTCITQPESIALSLDAFFFNRWESSIVYAFPKGCDARYWQAFAEATTRAAKYEDYVWKGRRCDDEVALSPDPTCAYPKPAKKVYVQYMPYARDVPLLQHVAYEYDGKLLVAVFNFADFEAARFTLKAKAGFSANLVVPPSRCRVFVFSR